MTAPARPEVPGAAGLVGPVGRAGRDEGLADLLRRRTRDVHAAAESSPYAVALAAGEVGPAGYAALLASLHPVYAELESGRMREDPRLAPFLRLGLDRLTALEHDLALLPPAAPEPGPAARAYAGRVAEVAEQPAAYLAHHWARYLGDLVGGQVLRSALARSLAAHPAWSGAAVGRLRFHDFRAVGAVPRLRRSYHELLDATPWVQAERVLLVAEARLAFDLNRALFDELAVAQLSTS